MSLCVPASGDPRRFRRSLAARLILIMVLGFGGVVGGPIIAGAVRHYRVRAAKDESVSPASIALLSMVAGIIFMLNAKRVERRTTRKYLERTGAPRPAFLPTEPPRYVSIEDPATFQRLKVVTEDAAALYPDAGRRLVVIEGFSHRYVIRGPDVVELSLRSAPYTVGVYILFRVAGADVQLGLIITRGTALQELKRQTIGAYGSPLADLLQRTLASGSNSLGTNSLQ